MARKKQSKKTAPKPKVAAVSNESKEMLHESVDSSIEVEKQEEVKDEPLSTENKSSEDLKVENSSNEGSNNEDPQNETQNTDREEKGTPLDTASHDQDSTQTSTQNDPAPAQVPTADSVEAAETADSAETAETAETADPVQPPTTVDTSGTHDGILQKYRTVIENLKQEITHLRDQNDNLESERDDIQEEYDNLLEKVSLIKQKLHERYEDLESKTKRAEADAAESARQVVKLTQKTTELENKNLELESAAKAHTDIVNEHLAQATSCKQQMVSQKIMFDQEISNANLTKEGLELEIAQLKANIYEINEQLTEKQRAESQLQQKLTDLESRSSALQTENEELKSTTSTKISHLESQNEQLLSELNDAKRQVSDLAKNSLKSTELETELKKEIKDQQLLIGKLRHEGVILNEHLTHALKIVRNNSEGQSVDKDLVSNLFLQYALCSRQDTKKFEILQLIANFLDWNDEYRQMSGLNRPQSFNEEEVAQNTQMVGVVGKLAEFLETKISKRSAPN